MIFELVYFRAQHDLDTSIWIIWIPHMSAITCRSSLLKLFAHPTHTHTPIPSNGSIHLWSWAGGTIVLPNINLRNQLQHIHDTFWYILYQTILYLLQGVSFWNYQTYISAVSHHRFLKKGYREKWWEMHLFRPCVINVWIPVFFNTCDLWQCPNSALCESTRVSKLQLAECTFTPFFGIVVPCAWEAPAWVKKLLQMSVTFRNIPYLYNIKKVLEHVKQLKLHSDGLHLQRWEASTTSLKV